MIPLIIGTAAGVFGMSFLAAYLWLGWKDEAREWVIGQQVNEYLIGRVAELKRENVALIPLAKIGAARKASWQAHRAKGK